MRGAHGEGILLSKGNGKGEKGRGRLASGYRCCSSRGEERKAERERRQVGLPFMRRHSCVVT